MDEGNAVLGNSIKEIIEKETTERNLGFTS